MKQAKVLKRLNPLFFQGICHRGLWNESLTENGLAAFKNAISHGLAFELDIHLSKDGQLIVCHDEQLKRTTGKDGIIEELTYDEIKTNYRLLDGEAVPSFQEVLDLDKEQCPIVVELKVYKDNYRALAKKAKQALKQIKDRRNIWVISFDPRALLWMGRRYIRALLVCHEKDWTWKFHSFFESVDLEDVMVAEPRVVEYHEKGGLINVWTVEKKEQFDSLLPYVDAVTFQKMDAAYVRATLKEKNKNLY